MRILALCDYYDEASIGGAERVAHEVYSRLASDPAVEVTVVGAVAGPGSRSEGGAGAVRVVRVPGWDLSRLAGGQLLVGQHLRRAAWAELRVFHPDVIHVNGLHFHSSAVGVRLARSRSLPLVATAHLGGVSAMPGRGRMAAAAFDRCFAARVARASDVVVAVSNSVASHMISLGVPEGRLRVARNGVDHLRFRADRRRAATPWLRAIVVGRLIANKGTLDVLEAVEAVRAGGRDVRLTVVGDGPQMAQVRHRVARADLAGAVYIAGRVSDVEEWLRASDVMLRPSYTEGLPLAVLESLACGTPVICSAVPGNTDVVTDGANGLVVPVGDVRALAAALAALYDDRRRLAGMSTAAESSAASYSWGASAAAHLAAFEAAADRRRRPRPAPMAVG